jgi:hypothetical protein
MRPGFAYLGKFYSAVTAETVNLDEERVIDTLQSIGSREQLVTLRHSDLGPRNGPIPILFLITSCQMCCTANSRIVARHLTGVSDAVC